MKPWGISLVAATALLVPTVLLPSPAPARTAVPLSAATTSSAYRIVAVGDSWASGAGGGDYRTPATCRRSAASAPRQLAALVRDRLGLDATVRDVSCRGASTRAYWASVDGRAPQRTAVTEGADLVVVSFSWGELAMSRVVESCLAARTRVPAGCRAELSRVESLLRRGTLGRHLRGVAADVRSRVRPDTTIALMGFPRLEIDRRLRWRGIALGQRLASVVERSHAILTEVADPRTAVVDTIGTFQGTAAWLPVGQRRRHELHRDRVSPSRWLLHPTFDRAARPDWYQPTRYGWNRVAHAMWADPRLRPQAPLGGGRSQWVASDGTDSVVSDDGGAVAFATADRVWVTSAATGEAVPVSDASLWARGPAISTDGSVVAYRTYVPGSGPYRVVVTDRTAGSTTPVPFGWSPVSAPMVSGDGRFVFALGQDASGGGHVGRYDRVSGDVVDLPMAAAPLDLELDVTHDGEQVVYVDRTSSSGRTLTLHDFATGATRVLRPDVLDPASPGISADGRLVSFETASRLVGGDANDAVDVYVTDRDSGGLTWLPAAGGVAPERPWTDVCGSDLAAGGAQVVVTPCRPSEDVEGRWHTETQLIDVATGEQARIAGADSRSDSVSADGSRVAWEQRAHQVDGGLLSSVVYLWTRTP